MPRPPQAPQAFVTPFSYHDSFGPGWNNAKPIDIDKTPNGLVAGNSVGRLFPSFLPKSPQSIEFRMHGGGDKNMYSLSQGFPDSADKVIRGSLNPDGRYGPFAMGRDLNINQRIKEVWSYACNQEGGGSPQFYETLVGQPLNKVTMVPKGYLGSPLAGVSSYPTKAWNFFAPKSHQMSPLHTYEKTQGQWQDKGEYVPKFDQFMQNNWGKMLLGAGGAYGIYKLIKYYNQKKKMEDAGFQLTQS